MIHQTNFQSVIMKNVIFVFCTLALPFFTSCNSPSSDKAKESQQETILEEELDIESVFSANQWDEFRFGVVNNDPDFDILKYYDPEQVSQEVVNNLLDDEYTKKMLESTGFEALEDAIFNGVSAKAFYVVAASGSSIAGMVYYFVTTSYGLQLLGAETYYQE
jgi:hypothetical protein